MNMYGLLDFIATIQTPLAATGSVDASTPLAGLVMPFFFIIAAMAIIYFKNYSTRKLQHETIRLMVEKGQQVTPAMFAEQSVALKQHNDRRSGLIWLAVGIGWFACFQIMSLIMVPALTSHNAIVDAYFQGRTMPSDNTNLSWFVFSAGPHFHITGTTLTQWMALVPAMVGIALLVNSSLDRREKKSATALDAKL